MQQASVVLLAAAALLIGDPLQAQPIGSTSPATKAVKPIRISLAIKNRKLANDVHRYIRITQGDALELVFTADEPAELHLHGYDIYLNLQPGTPGVLHVDAKIAGRFALESHRVRKQDRRADYRLTRTPGAPVCRGLPALAPTRKFAQRCREFDCNFEFKRALVLRCENEYGCAR